MRYGLGMAGLVPFDVVKYLANSVKQYLLGRTASGDILMPLDGDVCRTVHGGHKIFDFRAMTVTKVFAMDVPENARQTEISGIREAGQLSFAPRFVDVGEDSEWVSESLVTGELGPRSVWASDGSFIENIARLMLPVFSEILQARPLESIRVDSLLERLDEQFEAVKYRSRFPELVKFVDLVRDSLRSQDSMATVLMGFSHGDLGLVNIVNSDGRVVVIDWESVDSRTVMNDFFNTLFVELYYERAARGNFREKLHVLSGDLADHVEGRAGLSASIRGNLKIYRRLYYLERLLLLLRRAPSDSSDRVIRKSIELFETFEQEPTATRDREGVSSLASDLKIS